MKWMIRVDMEGVTGVVKMSQVVPGAADYAFGRSMMMHDLLAVLEGLLQAEEDEVWLYDIHFDGTNIELQALDPRVTAICGKPHYGAANKTFLDDSFDGMILLGLHARAGMPGALLHHNYEHDIQSIIVRGADASVHVGEIGLEALMAGEAGVPLVLVTGDSEGCAEAEALLPGTVTASVKMSLGDTAAACLPPARTRALLADAARRSRSAAARLEPYRLPGPIELELTFAAGELLTRLQGRLGASFRGPDRLLLTGETVTEAWAKYLHAKA
ncbi:M55 family metallopeptidase [Paenibacillus sp. IB182496]|uniref:M55 family metallopeptidase n=1 Tax=Paenibacillus sabuli TaxID=2772509 RepID=A0A927GTF8_9BACL|nr:M55 family metallopeptidase [Paenibacillus sabuli]MBD2847533.1 M55 family metallopeptidase [Paenibacillus sabuli]